MEQLYPIIRRERRPLVADEKPEQAAWKTEATTGEKKPGLVTIQWPEEVGAGLEKKAAGKRKAG